MDVGMVPRALLEPQGTKLKYPCDRLTQIRTRFLQANARNRHSFLLGLEPFISCDNFLYLTCKLSTLLYVPPTTHPSRIPNIIGIAKVTLGICHQHTNIRPRARYASLADH